MATPGSLPTEKFSVPTPRITTLPMTSFWITRPGVRLDNPSVDAIPAASSSSPEKAAIESGVSCTVLERFSAVTTTSSRTSVSAASAGPEAMIEATVAATSR